MPSAPSAPHTASSARRPSALGRVARLDRERQGLLLCVLAATCFGTVGVLTKLAYAEGVNVITLLAARFALGSALLWALAAARGVARLPRTRTTIAAIAFAIVLYSVENGVFFAALTRLDASLVELTVFTYPAMVVVAAILLGREPASRRRLGAVALATGGVALVLLGGSIGALDGLGIALALSAAGLYSAYVLVADTLRGRIPPLTLAAVVSTGALIAYVGAGVVTGGLRPGDIAGDAWIWVALVGIAGTAIGMSAFLAGVDRLGPSRAAIISTLDPVVTVTVAALVLGDRLTPAQLVGGALVIGAIVVLRSPGMAAVRGTIARPWRSRSLRRSARSSPVRGHRFPTARAGRTSPSSTVSGRSRSSMATSSGCSHAAADRSSATSLSCASLPGDTSSTARS